MVGCHTLMTRDKVFVRSRRKACWTVFLNGPLKQRSAVQSLFLFALSLILVSSQHCSVEGLATALTSILNICTLKPWNHSLRSSFRASERARKRERERERERAFSWVQDCAHSAKPHNTAPPMPHPLPTEHCFTSQHVANYLQRNTENSINNRSNLPSLQLSLDII